MFVCSYFEETYIRSKLPTVDNFFNCYHPSDLIAYRVEPIIKNHEYNEEDFLSDRGIDRIEDSEAMLDQGGYDSSSESNSERDEQYWNEEPEILPPVLIPCYWNQGLNKAQMLLMFVRD